MAGFTGSGGKRPSSGQRALGGDKSSGGAVGKKTVFATGAPKSQADTAMTGGAAGQESVSGGAVKVAPVKQPADQDPSGE